jgi:AhpD family alkylhydroperoxidase
MQARMKNPAMIVPDAMQALLSLAASTKKGGVPQRTLDLIHLRASQINGCSVCVDMHARDLKKVGETDERLFAVAAWRDAPYFTDPERAALALTEAVTRLSDRADPVPDEIWDEATRQYDEPALAALIIANCHDKRGEPPQRDHQAGGGRVGEVGRGAKMGGNRLGRALSGAGRAAIVPPYGDRNMLLTRLSRECLHSLCT